MLTVKTHIDISPIAGIGLFASENIKKGTVTWRYHPSLDRLMSMTEYESLEPDYKQFVDKYEIMLGDYIIMLGDDSRFTNHSFNPSVINSSDTECVASRDIKMNEELTEDYNAWWWTPEETKPEFIIKDK